MPVDTRRLAPNGQNYMYGAALNDLADAVLQPASQDIAYAASITPNAQSGQVVVVGTLTGAMTINAPTGAVKGMKLFFCFTQDATGSRVVTWNAIFRNPGTVVAAANAKSCVGFVYDGSAWAGLVVA